MNSLKLIYGEIFMALNLQSNEGTFICKIFDIFLKETISLLYILYLSYDTLIIHKTDTIQYFSTDSIFINNIDTLIIEKIDTLLIDSTQIIPSQKDNSVWRPKRFSPFINQKANK